MNWHNRHECKFVVAPAVAQRLREFVMPFVAPDPFAARSPDHSYAISSLYLDDAVHSLYRETVDGLPTRFKLRVRCYDDRADSQIWLEVKRRHDRVIRKLRCPIPRTALSLVLAGHQPDLADADDSKGAALTEFSRLMQIQRAFPRLLVRYRRQAYMGRDEPNVRVTFDRELATASESRSVVRLTGRFEPLPLRGVVVELKFTDRYPQWLLTAVRRFELRRGSFSKYCRSAETLADLGQTALR